MSTFMRLACSIVGILLWVALEGRSSVRYGCSSCTLMEDMCTATSREQAVFGQSRPSTLFTASSMILDNLGEIRMKYLHFRRLPQVCRRAHSASHLFRNSWVRDQRTCPACSVGGQPARELSIHHHNGPSQKLCPIDTAALATLATSLMLDASSLLECVKSSFGL